MASATSDLDRFHILAHLSKAIDEVRAKEAKRLKAAGYEPVLKGMRFCLLKRPENLSDSQADEAGRAPALQPQDRARLPAEG